ncbi:MULTISPECIES: hypothetical protein [unclassified Sphingopyxis]|uniref:hypothetical protein n=1 Tax=unclassified Sphingopyxis TaxID=2614943 RepID=UPI000736BD95|nr:MULTISPECIES: hypothetical protein [unclassified Sphingopyxis]KTE36533.1 hypothetical protein ATE62_14340 [Sphingopyxis sp. HIX]KTE84511.1 hypothetical protein ATE72_08630 [Sphingopyxis sp. HXXIV]
MKISEAQALAEILNRQHETLEEAEIAELEPRLADYARGAPWRDDDAARVWASPSARRAYLGARRAVLAELEMRWADRRFDRSFVRMAADDGDPDELVLGEAGVTVRIVRAPGSGDWLVSVALSPDALALIPAGTGVRIADSGGVTWLSGLPDRDGGVDAFWDRDESPMTRLRTHSLTLGFV